MASTSRRRVDISGFITERVWRPRRANALATLYPEHRKVDDSTWQLEAAI